MERIIEVLRSYAEMYDLPAPEHQAIREKFAAIADQLERAAKK